MDHCWLRPELLDSLLFRPCLAGELVKGSMRPTWLFIEVLLVRVALGLLDTERPKALREAPGAVQLPLPPAPPAVLEGDLIGLEGSTDWTSAAGLVVWEPPAAAAAAALLRSRLESARASMVLRWEAWGRLEERLGEARRLDAALPANWESKADGRR